MTEHIIISLTSIKDRLDLLQTTLDSLLKQTIPVIINVFLSIEPFLLDTGYTLEDIAFLKEKYPSIIFDIVPNIGSFRKLIPALKKYSRSASSSQGEGVSPSQECNAHSQSEGGSIIITVDDDTIYETTTAEKLVNTYHKYLEQHNEKCIVASSVRYFNPNTPNRFFIKRLPYIKTVDGNGHLYAMAQGVGCILYHTSFFDEKFINMDYKSPQFFDNREIILRNDDIYFRLYTFKKQIKIVKIDIDIQVSLRMNCLWKQNRHIFINKPLIDKMFSMFD